MIRSLTLAVVVAGAAGSIALMLRAGSRQQSVVLIALFIGWVLLPFVAMGWAVMVSKSWSSSVQVAYCAVSVFVTLGSGAMYAGVIPMPSGSRPAAVFLAVPLVSWIVFAILAGALRLRRDR